MAVLGSLRRYLPLGVQAANVVVQVLAAGRRAAGSGVHGHVLAEGAGLGEALAAEWCRARVRLLTSATCACMQ